MFAQHNKVILFLQASAPLTESMCIFGYYVIEKSGFVTIVIISSYIFVYEKRPFFSQPRVHYWSISFSCSSLWFTSGRILAVFVTDRTTHFVAEKSSFLIHLANCSAFCLINSPLSRSYFSFTVVNHSASTFSIPSSFQILFLFLFLFSFNIHVNSISCLDLRIRFSSGWEIASLSDVPRWLIGDSSSYNFDRSWRFSTTIKSRRLLLILATHRILEDETIQTGRFITEK